MQLRTYNANDLQEIAQLFYDTIRCINKKDYSKKPIEVWCATKEHLLQKNDFFQDKIKMNLL